jgi:hypothetical protein
MIIERTKNEVIIRISANINTDDLQDFVNYVRYKELTSKFKVSQKKVDSLVSEVKKDWMVKNRNKFKK